MKLVLQRVASAGVTIQDGPEKSPSPREIGQGLVILAGFCQGDDEKTCEYMAKKAVELRIFEDEREQMNLSLKDVEGGCLIVSNFTLYANARKGRRPSFVAAAPPAVSEPLYRCFVQAVRDQGIAHVETGEFGAMMQVQILNDGPVTLVLDSDEIMPK